ncbi:MAG: hypothetical protein HC782_02515 [Gammaproteobacteria bacterium]|nr:hypothetical protein [Gammaproteobacteria bacterium]
MSTFVRLYNNRPHIVRAPLAELAGAALGTSSSNDFFADFFRSNPQVTNARVPTIELDVTENAAANTYTISAALPGVQKDILNC